MSEPHSRRLVAIYRSTRIAEMYLYVDRTAGLTEVPGPLLERFGSAELVTTMLLDASRRLARATASEVLADIGTRGYHLQLPPPPVMRNEHGVRADHVPLVPSDRVAREGTDDE